VKGADPRICPFLHVRAWKPIISAISGVISARCAVQRLKIQACSRVGQEEIDED
jgi:hypothetical protein